MLGNRRKLGGILGELISCATGGKTLKENFFDSRGEQFSKAFGENLGRRQEHDAGILELSREGGLREAMESQRSI